MSTRDRFDEAAGYEAAARWLDDPKGGEARAGLPAALVGEEAAANYASLFGGLAQEAAAAAATLADGDKRAEKERGL